MEDKKAIISFIKDLSLFQKMSEKEISHIADCLELKHYKTGDFIFHESEGSTYMCLLYRGEVDILKHETNEPFKIRTLKSGEMFGEMAFIDEKARSASVKSKTDCSILILRTQVFQKKEMELIYEKLISNISKIIVPRLRNMNESYVCSLREHMKALQLQTQFGRFFVCLIVIFSIGGIFETLVKERIVTGKGELFSWSYLVGVFLPTLPLLKIFHFKLSDAGISLLNWKKSILEGTVLSLACWGTFWALHIPIHDLLKYFDVDTLRYTDTAFITFGYFIACYMQEFITRGITQTVLQRFYNDFKGEKSVFITSLIFAAFHFHISFIMAFNTFIFGLLFGAIYLRHRNLIGVTLVHFSLGVIGKLMGLF